VSRHAFFVEFAGLVQVAIAAANVGLPRRLPLAQDLPRLSPIVRQMFVVHWVYVLGVLLLFSTLCVAFPEDLAGGSALGRALSAGLALFWLPRAILQLFYYDRGFTSRHRAGHLAFLASFVYLAAIFSLAALGVLR
jgi:hypothetical protein